MDGIFDASQGASTPKPDPLAGMVQDDIERRIRAINDRVADLAAREAEKDEAEDFDPDLERRFAEIAGADDAPLEFQSLAGQVQRGTLTWKQLYLRPRDHGKAGVRLLGLVLSASVRDTQSQLVAVVAQGEAEKAAREVEEQRRDQRPGGGPGGAPGQPPPGPGQPGGAGGR